MSDNKSSFASDSTSSSGFTTVQWLVCVIAAIGFAFDIYELLMLPLIVKPALLELGGVNSAGAPILAAENIEDYLTIEKIFPVDGRGFALRVKGDSMIGDGICDGDIVIVKPRRTAQNGDIVVAIIEDEATVKRLRRVGGRVELLPENDAYSPIVADEITLCGVVVGVLRAL